MATTEEMPKNPRSSSSERDFSSSSDESEDDSFFRPGPRVPEFSNFDITVVKRSMELPRVTAVDSDESAADEEIRMRCVNVDLRRTGLEPEAGERDRTVPDLGEFGFHPVTEGSNTGAKMVEDNFIVNSLAVEKHVGGGGEGSPRLNGNKKGVDLGVVFPKKVYVMGTGSSPALVLIRTRHCRSFLNQLKATIEAIRYVASERRLSGRFTTAKAIGEGDGSGPPSKKNSRTAGFLKNDEADSSDDLSDDGFDCERGLEKVEGNADDIKRAIEGMEAELPKLPKINRFLKSVGVETDDLSEGRSVESVGVGCSTSLSSGDNHLRPEVYDFLLQTVEALQSVANGVLEECDKLDLEGVLDRVRMEIASCSNEPPPGVEALFEELYAHLARVDQQAKVTLDTKQALMTISSRFSPLISCRMSEDQASKLMQITSAMKNDQRKLDNMERKLDDVRSDIQSTLAQVACLPEPKEITCSSYSSRNSRAVSELSKENQRLRRLADGKDTLVKELKKELETMKNQHIKTKNDIMASVDKLCAEFMQQEKEKFKKEKEELKEKFRREKAAGLNAEAIAMSKHYDKRLSVERGLIEAHFRQEGRKKESEIREEMLADFAQRWEVALNRADERQIELEDMFKNHLEKNKKGWKNKIQRAREAERRLCEAKVNVLRREFAKSLAILGMQSIQEMPTTVALTAIGSPITEVAQKEIQVKPSMVSVEIQEQPVCDDAMNQTSLSLLPTACDNSSQSASDDSDFVIAELREQLHECSTELDLLDQENSTLIEEYTKLRTKYLASEEGTDYLVQRLEALKSIIQEKDEETKEIVKDLQQKFEMEAREQEVKLRAELQEQLVTHVQGVEDAILDRYQMAIRKHSALLRKKFANVKQNYRAKIDRKMKNLNTRWENFLCKERTQIAEAHGEAVADAQRKLRLEFQQKLDDEMKELEGQANQRLTKIMEAAEDAKVAETLEVLRKMRQQLQEEHTAKLEATLAAKVVELDQVKAAAVGQVEKAKAFEIEQLKKVKMLEIQELEKVKMLEIQEMEKVKAAEVAEAKVAAEKVGVARTLKAIAEDFLQPFPISTLAASVKLLALRQLKSQEEDQLQQGLASLIDLLRMSHLHSRSLPFSLHSPIRAILSVACQEEIPQDIQNAASSPALAGNPLELTTLAKNISKEMKKKVEKELAKQKEKMRQELLQEFKESELNLMNGKMLEKIRKYVQAKVEERLLSEKELFEERLTIERQAFAERLTEEKQAWKKKNSEVWEARLKELGGLLSEKMQQQGAGIRVLTDTNATSLLGHDGGMQLSSDATSAVEFKASSSSGKTCPASANNQATAAVETATASDLRMSSIAEVFNDIKKLLTALRVVKDAHNEKEVISSSAGEQKSAEKEKVGKGETSVKEATSTPTFLTEDFISDTRRFPSGNPDLFASSSSLSLFLGRTRYPGRISDDSSVLLRRRFRIGSSEEEGESATLPSTFRDDLMFIDDFIPRDRRRFWDKPITPLSSDVEFDLRRSTYNRYPEFDFSPVDESP